MSKKNAISKYLELMEAAKAYCSAEKVYLSEPEQVADYIRPTYLGQEQEIVSVLYLNTRNHLLGVHTATIGLANSSQLHPREVFREAIVNNASRIIVCHNHPSGDVTPSAQDISMTKQLLESGKIIGIELIDHLVISGKDTGFTSLRKLGHIS